MEEARVGTSPTTVRRRARGFWHGGRTPPGFRGLKPPRGMRGPMKRDLMEILCCPVCKGDLELKVDLEKDEILEGSLYCKACNHRYEIKDGIPDLLPPDFK